MTHSIQWYPGHIAKMERSLNQYLKLVDVVVHVVDARLPEATTNLRLLKKFQNKPLVSLFNKTDLADPIESKRWREYYQKHYGHEVLLYTTTTSHPQQKKELLERILHLGEPKMKGLEAKGMKRRPIRAMVIGMPNVGKSSVINHIVTRKKAKTGHKAGVTREPQWIRIHPQIELLDSPGIIPPRLDSQEVGFLLASVSGVGENTFDDETVASFLLHRLDERYPQQMRAFYKIPQEEPLSFQKIATQRCLLASGAKPDERRAIQVVLTEFRQGRLGRLTLESPPED